MILLYLLADFAAGLFICNAVPHLAAGLMGQSFPTPFASPPGKGSSSPMTNFLWGFLNLVIGCAFYSTSAFSIGLNTPTLLFFLGVLIIGAYLAWRFGKVRNGS